MKLMDNKMNKQQLKDRIERRLESLKAAQTDLDCASQIYADFMCPYKIGVVLTDNKGNKATLTKIEFTSLSGVGFKLYGIKIKKNGSDYNHASGLHGYQGWRKE